MMENHKKELRNFGLAMTVMVPLSFGTILPFLFRFERPLWPWPVSMAFLFCACFIPQVLHYIHRPWIKVAKGMAQLQLGILMAVLFYAVFTPLAIVLRIFGRDLMHGKFEKGLGTYRNAPDMNPSNMKMPF